MEEYFKLTNKYLDEGWKMTAISCDEGKCTVGKFIILGITVGKPGDKEDILCSVQDNKRCRV